MRTTTRLLMTVNVALAVTGCGGGDDESAADARPSPTRSIVTERSTPPATVSAQPSEPAGGDATATALADLKLYLKDNFDGTTWYSHITDVRPFGGNAVEIQTDLFPDSDAGPLATSICAGVSSFVFSNDQTVLTGVRVAASDGQRLVLRRSLSDSCQA